MDLMDHMNLMDYMNAVMQNSPFCPSGSNKYRFFENKKNPEKQLLLLLPDFFFFKRTENYFLSVFSAVFSAGFSTADVLPFLFFFPFSTRIRYRA